MDHALGPWLLVSLVVSSIGFVLLVYGKKLARFPQLLVGLTLSIYPYFVTSLAPMLVIAGVLLLGLWIAVRLGW